MTLPSRFQLGDEVIVAKKRATVSAVIFSVGKVSYLVDFADGPAAVQVDSAFVSPKVQLSLVKS